MRDTPKRAPAREAMRSANQLAVFDAVHRHGPISRVELAGMLRLSAASVTDITAELIERRLLFEAREAESTGVGRRKVLLEVDYEHASVVGVKVTNAAVHAAVTDLKGEVRTARVDPLPSCAPDAVVAQVVATLRRLRMECETDVVGLGASVPGSVEPVSGTVTYSPLLGWTDVRLGELLERSSGLPVVLENDVNCLAAAEAWFGHGHEVSDFLVVTLGRGVGLGIIIDGKLYRGPFGGAGELGHVVLAPGGPEAAHSKAGTVEAYLSDDGLVRQGRRSVASFPQDGDVDDLLALAAEGDEEALALYERAGRLLGQVLGMLVNLFAPALVVLAGEGMRAERFMVPAASEALAEHGFGDLGARTPVVVEPWGDDAWARGAATLAASHYMESEASRLGGERQNA